MSRRVVIVGGVRTPFVRAFAEFAGVDTIALGCAAVRRLLDRTGIARAELDAIVWGGVLLPGMSPNVGREIALDLRLPPTVEGMTVTRACAAGLQAITTAAAAIERGDHDVAIAGGSDSTSNAEVKLPTKLVQAVAPIALGKATPGDVLGILAQLRPAGALLPRMPRIAERTTGQVMGEAAEEIARRNEISREAQDAFAVRSHLRAAAAIASGRFAREVVPVEAERWVHTDRIVRGDASEAQLAKLAPAFAKHGTVTAGNSSPLTDGAAAVLLMAEDKAKALGLAPLAALRSWAYAGVDPADQLLIGPALAIPKALARAGMALDDLDLVDLHEAFAAQVLAVTKRLGELDPARLNVHGGSIAIGHPFGATGARMVTTMANELHATGKATAIVALCAAGGLGAAAILENV